MQGRCGRLTLSTVRDLRLEGAVALHAALERHSIITPSDQPSAEQIRQRPASRRLSPAAPRSGRLALGISADSESMWVLVGGVDMRRGWRRWDQRSTQEH